MTRFQNRTRAGRALAEALAQKEYDSPVVLALPRGGVPVAIEVVRALHAPMDLVMVRKIGAPSQPELAVAAVVNGEDPQTVVNSSIARAFGLSQDNIDTMAQSELAEIRRRRGAYLGGRDQVPVEGRTAIVVDDGIATGATMRAALKGLARRGPARLVLAVPVAPSDVVAALSDEVDEVVCLAQPQPFSSIGAHYVDFTQTSDSEVIRLMDEAAELARTGAATRTDAAGDAG